MSYIFKNHARREFLKRTAAFGALGVAGGSALNMAAMGRAAANGVGDYKALVCVFLYGANDNYNTFVPYDLDSYNAYASARPTLATARAALNGSVLTPQQALPDGKSFALAPQLGNMNQLWTEDKMGILLNVGPLEQPTTKQQYTQNSVPIPPRIFSHNDQQSVWQSLQAEGSTTGWGGRMADYFLTGDSVTDMFSAISVTGNSLFLSGDAVIPYQVTPEGSISLITSAEPAYGSQAVSDAVNAIMANQLTPLNDINLIKEAHVEVVNRSILADQILENALNGVNLNTSFSSGPLSSQLNMVAKIIAARNTLGNNRQVFFVGLGGFDVHSDQLENHPPLLEEVNRAMQEFFDATTELQLADQITTFTASDFGRTLSSNGDGTDHGWGGHHMIMGGAVNGGTYYGLAPELGDNGIDDVGRGRLLPTTSVTQMASTLGIWFGCSPSEIEDILPSIIEYSQQDLGFLS